MIRAFLTVCYGVTCLVYSSSASKARYVTYKTARDAGYYPRFQDIKVKRCREADDKVAIFSGHIKDNTAYSVPGGI